MKCPKCGEVYHAIDAAYCHVCGHNLVSSKYVKCPKCNEHDHPYDAIYCHKCGFDLSDVNKSLEILLNKINVQRLSNYDVGFIINNIGKLRDNVEMLKKIIQSEYVTSGILSAIVKLKQNDFKVKEMLLSNKNIKANDICLLLKEESRISLYRTAVVSPRCSSADRINYNKIIRVYEGHFYSQAEIDEISRIYNDNEWYRNLINGSEGVKQLLCCTSSNEVVAKIAKDSQNISVLVKAIGSRNLSSEKLNIIGRECQAISVLEKIKSKEATCNNKGDKIDTVLNSIEDIGGAFFDFLQVIIGIVIIGVVILVVISIIF